MNRGWLFILTLIVLINAIFYFLENSYATDPDIIHITIMGNKNDINAERLYQDALKYAPKNSQIEWQDKSSTTYQMLNRAAAYVCIPNRCSLPSFTSKELISMINYIQSQQVNSNNITKTKIMTNKIFNNHQIKFQDILQTKNPLLIMPLFWFFGFMLALTPCVLPLLLIMTSIAGAQKERLAKKKVFSLSVIYVLSLSISYAFIGMLVALFGIYIQIYMQNVWIIGAFSLLFIILGISSLGVFNLKLPVKQREALSYYNKALGGTYIGVAMMGILATLIASPCTAAPLAGVLTFVTATGDIKLGILSLFSIGIGMGTPLIIINTLGGELLYKSGKWQKIIKQFFGLVLIGIAIWLLGRILSGIVVMYLWGILFIFSAINMGAFAKQKVYRPHLIDILVRLAAIMILMYGSILLVGAVIGNTNSLSPLDQNTNKTLNSENMFMTVNNMAAVQQSLSQAQINHKPLILLFTANWCISCLELQHDVFSDPAVQVVLQQFILIKVDLTVSNIDTLNIARNYGVAGPPSTLIFSHKDQLPLIKLDGVIGKEKLIMVMKEVLKKY